MWHMYGIIVLTKVTFFQYIWFMSTSMGLHLTHWGRVRHICVIKLIHHWFRQWFIAWPAPSHYLNQCWNIVNWILGNKFQWNFHQNTTIFIQENAFENVVCKMASISCWPQRVKCDESLAWSKTDIFWKHCFTLYSLALLQQGQFSQKYSQNGPLILSHCGLVMLCGHIDLDQHWPRLWLVAWCHQAITWANVDLSWIGFCGTM